MEKRADGVLVMTHGHHFPDDIERVVLEYEAAGTLRSVQFEWTGFTSQSLDIHVEVDERSKVVKVEGCCAAEVITNGRGLIRPLPTYNAQEEEPDTPVLVSAAHYASLIFSAHGARNGW